MLVTIIVSIVSFFVGAIGALLLRMYFASKDPNIHVITRLYPTLPYARDIYNKVAFKLDKECADFKLIRLEIKPDKKMQAFAVVCTYKSLSNKIFTF